MLHFEEHDSCGIVAVMDKNGIPSRSIIEKTIDALIKMDHRSGFINGEGDGSGVLTDIPRKLWETKLKNKNIPEETVYSPQFTIGHIFIDQSVDSLAMVQETIREQFNNYQFEIIFEELNQVDNSKLGPNGRSIEPLFWQIASVHKGPIEDIRKDLFLLTTNIEKDPNIHVASLSNYSVVYKVMGAGEVLAKYFYDLKNPLFDAISAVGHNRFSTNTLSHFFRVQPFSLLAHNGEINTIHRLRDEAKMLGIPLTHEGSDSQDLNRVIESLLTKYNFNLFTVMEIIFPPIYNEIFKLDDRHKSLYTLMRHFWGPFSQGPAGIVSRYEDHSVFSVDALGLRPLWMVETDNTLYFSSEQGIVPATDMVVEPKPLAPGEKIGVRFTNNRPIEIYEYDQFQQTVIKEVTSRFELDSFHKKLVTPTFKITKSFSPPDKLLSNGVYKAFGWKKENVDMALSMAETGKEPISSLGFDGPLAILSEERVNIADFLKETVAVVTNPAIDREREIEHFSTRMILGGRENIFSEKEVDDHSFEIHSPILLEGEFTQTLAKNLGTTTLEQTIDYFSSISKESIAILSITLNKEQSIRERLEQLNNQAVKAVRNGSRVIVLDDSELFTQDNQLWIDPHLCTSSIDLALKRELDNKESLRRKVSIIVRSGSIRQLHDLITTIGLGADAVSPYLLFATVSKDYNLKYIENLYHGLNKGLEKVISTLGIFELRGYGRLFSSIGLNKEIADILKIVNFFGNEKSGYSLEMLLEESKKRFEDFKNEQVKLSHTFHLIPRIWKTIGDVANGKSSYKDYQEKLSKLEAEKPIALRHLLGFRFTKSKKFKSKANIAIGYHDMPFIISSMSFGSQNETAFRAYAEAAFQLNMLSLNGEGGELKDMIGKYPKNRGMQIASGRFGVNIGLINSSEWIEIKIGQGAKPGEGGHLPGTKVSLKIAETRNATEGSDLISPSNNHDIYSIEDLEQIISELKAANKYSKVIVKVPVVPNIGTIGVGIAKAGADVISLSGFDGGTGAARQHAIQHVGLPVEIGIKLVHASLLQSGLRSDVEIWADGGVRSGEDVVKLVLLGANRVGFGTLSMIAIGCTSCRGCHLDTCHVGISTQINSINQAKGRGLKRFVPREFDVSVDRLKRFFTALANEVKEITANLGANSLQTLVGKSDLLTQVRHRELLDLTLLLKENKAKQRIVSKMKNLEMSIAAGAEVVEVEAIDITDYEDKHINCTNRMIGSSLSHDMLQQNLYYSKRRANPVNLLLQNGSIPGNGLGAYLTHGININVLGGGQDGFAKTAFGGRITLLKTKNKNGYLINGSVGKSCCYGAQKGLFIIQGNADSRAGIRLSGADLIIGGEIKSPLKDELGNLGSRANIKGFAFEYMTNGRVVVLGDPGPWICSGMTGGVIYQRLVPQYGLDIPAIKRRIAKGAKVLVLSLDENNKKDLEELLYTYANELVKRGQADEYEKVMQLINDLPTNFVRIVAERSVDKEALLTE